jgi:hypothetical protein
MHVRFSHSEVEFIPSIALSALVFTLTHVAMKDSEGIFRVVALFALPFVAALTFMTRPLNQIFVPLLLVTALYLARREAPLRRRLGVSVAIAVTAVWVFVTEFWNDYQDQVRDGAALETVIDAVVAFLSSHNTLLNPWVTPTGLALLALFGAWAWWKSGSPKRKEAVAFILFWLGSFYLAHGYVVPHQLAMQARYHLHLVVPFTLLAGLGFAALWARRRAWAVAVLPYAAAGPFLHAGFVHDVEFDEQRELAFLERARGLVPEGCTVLEHQGGGDDAGDARFVRLGDYVDATGGHLRFHVIPIRGGDGSDPLTGAARAVLRAPPECVVYYEGLYCVGSREPTESIARACREVRARGDWERIDGTSFRHRPYDTMATLSLDPDEPIPIDLGLYRLRALR